MRMTYSQYKKRIELEDQLIKPVEQNIEVVEEISPQQQQHPHHVHRYRSFCYTLLIVLTIGCSSFYYGYSMMYLPAMDFQSVYSLYNISIRPSVAQGVLVACIPLGAGLGAISSSLLVQKFSRRHCLLIVNAMAIVATLLLAVTNFQFFVVARLFQGYCTGLLSSIAPLMMKELSPIEISGTLTSCHQILIACGATFAFVFSLLINSFITIPQIKWAFLSGFCLVITITQTLLLMTKFRFETPKYLLLNQRQKQAKQLIKIIYMDEYVEEVFKEMKYNLKQGDLSQSSQSERNSNSADIQLVEMYIEKFTKTQKTAAQSQQKIIAKPSHRKTPCIAIIVALHLSILHQMCGVKAVVAYGGQIVGELKPELKLTMPILINMLQFVGSIFASYLLTRVGRKVLLEMGALTTAIGTCVVGVGFLFGQFGFILFGLVFFMVAFGLTLGPVVWIYLSEIAQPKILSLSIAANWGTCSLVMLLFPIIKKELPGQNPAYLFFFYAIWCMTSYFINLKFIIETRNKGEKQIHSEYENFMSSL